MKNNRKYGAIGGKISAGIGHGATYWKRVDVTVEAFAEMQEAYISNTEALDAIREYLPKSLSTFDEMMKYVARRIV